MLSKMKHLKCWYSQEKIYRLAEIDVYLPSKIFKRCNNISVLQNELKYFRKSAISEQNNNKIIPNKSKAVY
jgi:hypothetical protein